MEETYSEYGQWCFILLDTVYKSPHSSEIVQIIDIISSLEPYIYTHTHIGPLHGQMVKLLLL